MQLLINLIGEHQSIMKNRLYQLTALFLCLSLTVGCGYFGGGKGEGKGMSVAKGGEFSKPQRPKFKIPVTVETLERERMFAYLQAVGTVVPVKEVELKPEMTGRIYYAKRWMEGNEVKKGEIFASMDDRELKLNINESELQLEMARSAIEPASAQLAQAVKDENFKMSMFERGAISKTEYDQSVLSRIQRQNQYDGSLKDVESRKMSLAKLKQEEEKVQIIIPFDGVLLPAQQSVSANQAENSGADLTLNNGLMVSQSAVQARLADIGEVYVALDVPAKDLLEIQIGQIVILEIYSRTGKQFEGVVNDISTSLNSGTRTYTVNVLVQNPEHILRPGMFAKAQIITEEKLDAIKIPREIIQVRNNNEVVFVAVEKPVKDMNEEGGEGAEKPQDGEKRPGSKQDKSKPIVGGGEKTAHAAEAPANIDEASGGVEKTGDGLDEEVFDEDLPVEEVKPDYIVEERSITRGIENRDFVEVVDGLREGEFLVILGYETLTDKVDVNLSYKDAEESGVDIASN